jgi:ketosteroid isomerase-like protein
MACGTGGKITRQTPMAGAAQPRYKPWPKQHQTNTMTQLPTSAALLLSLCAAGCATVTPTVDLHTARDQVMATERAFAQTMADRDHSAFTRFLSTDAVFFSGTTPLRGKQAVADHWARFYAGAAAPFSWEPKDVEVLDSGDLALSSGPVRDASGKLIATFTSIWRREAPATWRIVFDKGNPVCPCAEKTP